MGGTAPLGPASLGRGAVVQPGQAPPDALGDAPRVRIDQTVLDKPVEVVNRLHLLWVHRTPVVVELAVDPGALRTPEQTVEPVYSHADDFLFPRERLVHLVWANTVDYRGSEPVWWHAVKAVRALPQLRPGGPADVLSSEGHPAWIDGGPRQPLATSRLGREDHLVLHRDDTERGVLAPQGRPSVASAQGLAPDQSAAVNAALGSVRVAAPAGSGKTRVLTARLRELVDERLIPGRAVLALAYNTKAAAEMRRRTPGIGGRSATVHSYALRVLRRHLSDVAVLEEPDVRSLLSTLIDLPIRANVDPLQPYIDSLEQVRIALIDPEKVAQDRDDIDDFPRIFTAYRDLLRHRNAVDFPEMVYRAVELLLADPLVRQAEQARVGQVLVDEFQDLTPAYLLFIRLLASPQLQCFGVGDDDQVIYGHAGATPTYLLDFDRLFPGAEDHPLTVNYRCPAPVVAAAVHLLENNTIRLDKTITAGPDAASTEPDVHRVHTTQQAQTAGDAVAKSLAAAVPPDDIAVLARVRVALLGTQADLTTRGIPTRSPIGEWLLARTGIRAALAYLRLATEDKMNGADLAEVLHRPLRRVPGPIRDTLRPRRWEPEQLVELADGRLDGGARKAMHAFIRDLDALRARARRQPTTEVLRYIADVIGLGKVAESLDASAGAQIASSHIDDLDALLQVADHCPDPAAFEPFLIRVVRQPQADGPGVTLSTIHSVKGLEWPHVVIVGCAEGIIPHRLAITPMAIEEERRVFHVAMTRAKAQLTVVAPRTGTSRFVDEMQNKPSLVAATAAPRPSAGRTTAPAKTVRPSTRSADTTDVGPTRFRAAVGLRLRASGGLVGTIESLSDDGVLVRTVRGSLLRVRYGSEVRVEDVFGTLSKP